GKKLNSLKCPANQLVRSVWEKPLAMASPAPKIKSTSQGNFLAAFQSISFSPPLPEGITNINKAPNTAIIVSSRPGINLLQINERVIQRNATKQNIKATRFSATVIRPLFSTV